MVTRTFRRSGSWNPFAVGVLALVVVGLGATPTLAQSSLLGDKDGFGLGLQEGDLWPVSQGFFDNRSEDDPFFTDVIPVPTVPINDGHPIESFTYTHVGLPQSLPVGTKAELRMLTLGIQDGDTQVVGSDTDLKLFLDGVEIAGAFDNVDQFEFFPGIGFASVAGLVTFEIPADLFYLFSDGEIEVRVDIHQLGTTQGVDVFAIDFSELIVTFPVIELLEDLAGDVGDLQLPHGLENALLEKLSEALNALTDDNPNNDHVAANKLEEFISQVDAQRGKKISEADADALISGAKDILLLL